MKDDDREDDWSVLDTTLDDESEEDLRIAAKMERDYFCVNDVAASEGMTEADANQWMEATRELEVDHNLPSYAELHDEAYYRELLKQSELQIKKLDLERETWEDFKIIAFSMFVVLAPIGTILYILYLIIRATK